MQRLEVSCAVRLIYVYMCVCVRACVRVCVFKRQRVKLGNTYTNYWAVNGQSKKKSERLMPH